MCTFLAAHRYKSKNVRMSVNCRAPLVQLAPIIMGYRIYSPFCCHVICLVGWYNSRYDWYNSRYDWHYVGNIVIVDIRDIRDIPTIYI
jgi:hypothetical protein